MTIVLLTTRLKVADPTAKTAFTTLKSFARLSREVSLAGLSREELFLLRVDADSLASRNLVDHLVRKTNLFLNPNKHTWRLDVEGEEPRTASKSTDDPLRAWLLVRDLDDETDFRESLWRHTGAREILSVRRMWLWCFEGAPGTSRDRLMAAMEEASVVTSRNHGFLVHPAFQDCRLYAARPNLYDIASVFDEAQPEGLSTE